MVAKIKLIIPFPRNDSFHLLKSISRSFSFFLLYKVQCASVSLQKIMTPQSLTSTVSVSTISATVWNLGRHVREHEKRKK